MKNLVCILFLSMCFSAGMVAQKSVVPQSEVAASLENIEFNLYPNPTEEDFKLQFLLPRDQSMEIFLMNMSGDLVSKLLEKQIIASGVKTFEFNFPDGAARGMYFLVIKSNGKAVIKKVDYSPRG